MTTLSIQMSTYTAGDCCGTGSVSRMYDADDDGPPRLEEDGAEGGCWGSLRAHLRQPKVFSTCCMTLLLMQVYTNALIHP